MHQIIFSLCYVKNMDTEASDLQMADIYWDNTIEQRPHLLVSLLNQVTLGDHRKHTPAFGACSLLYSR